MFAARLKRGNANCIDQPYSTSTAALLETHTLESITSQFRGHLLSSTILEFGSLPYDH